MREALAQGARGDIDIANFALALEYTEAAFYERALRDVRGLDAREQELVTTLRDHEVEHVEALRATVKRLGGRPARPPQVNFGTAFDSPDSFFESAQVLEDLGVGAYNGAAPFVASPKVQAAAASIVQVEARHAGAIRQLRGKKVAPDAFDSVLERGEVESKLGSLF